MKKKLVFYLQLICLLPLMPILGALKVKPADASVAKWSENASRAGAEFAANTEAAADDWARMTAASADNFHQAITAPGMKERFRRGVVKAGAAKFARKVREVGRDRFGPGVAAATEDYKLGVEPYLSTLAAITLSPRKPRGDPANYKRVEEIGKALNAKRLAMLGGGGG